MQLTRAPAGLLLLLAAACANIEPPPGGPPDVAPPVLLSTVPESLGVYPGFDDHIEFRFNEVVSEGTSPSMGLGTGDLERLILLSPGLAVPRVSWKRDRILVKPGGGWRRNTVYRVELKPGVSDLNRNRSDESVVLTFSTGGALPADTLSLQVLDWEAGRAAARALVFATLMPDSLVYRARADSAGRLVLGPMPQGRYLLTAVVDQNGNDRQDRREAFDSTSVDSLPVSGLALWAFSHDTVGPRVDRVTVRDSLNIEVSFTQSLLPGQSYQPAMARLLALPDSTPVEILTILPPETHDSLYRQVADSAAGAPDSAAAPAPAAPDTAAATPDTAAVEIDPVQELLNSRPRLSKSLMVRGATPLVRERSYYIEFYGLRNVTGAESAAAGLGFIFPAAPIPPPSRADTTAAGVDADSAAVNGNGADPDSAAAAPDSVGRGGARR